jgi:hypothetical protein
VLLVVKDLSRIVYRLDDALSFDVVDLAERQGGWLGREPGVFLPLLKWTTECVTEGSARLNEANRSDGEPADPTVNAPAATHVQRQ